MPKFRKRPIVVEAVRYDGTPESIGAIGKLVDDEGIPFLKEGNSLIIPTLEGAMRVDIGDWIIRGAHGELYPGKPDIFEKTYEPVDE